MKYLFKYLIVIFIFLISILLYLSSSSANFNYKFYVISSDSMSPNLNKGSLAAIKSENNFSVGDIITFKSPIERGNFITHRIIRENFEDEAFFTVKGDNNSAEDPWRITQDMITGKVSASVPFVGYPILFLKSSKIYIFLVGGIILLIGFVEVNFLSKEVVYEWERRNQYKFFRKITRFTNAIDRFMGRFHQDKIENTPV